MSSPEFLAVLANWEAYKQAIFEAYPGSIPATWWTSDDFDNLCTTLASQPITSIVDFAAFHWKISTAGYLRIKSNHMDELEF